MLIKVYSPEGSIDTTTKILCSVYSVFFSFHIFRHSHLLECFTSCKCILYDSDCYTYQSLEKWLLICIGDLLINRALLVLICYCQTVELNQKINWHDGVEPVEYQGCWAPHFSMASCIIIIDGLVVWPGSGSWSTPGHQPGRGDSVNLDFRYGASVWFEMVVSFFFHIIIRILVLCNRYFYQIVEAFSVLSYRELYQLL